MLEIKIIGITGGIGSGKSAFANMIREMGFTVIDMDFRAKELMTESLELKRKLIAAFGQETYIADGTLNKNYLAQIVFSDSPESANNLQILNSLVHPATIDDKIKTIENLIESGETLIFVESALLFEAGLADGYDYIININSNKELKIKRLKDSRNMTEKEILNRINSQLSDEEKIREADFNVENNGSLDDLKRSALFMVDLLKNLPCKQFD